MPFVLVEASPNFHVSRMTRRDTGVSFGRLAHGAAGNRVRFRRAFTLVEVIIAAAVIGLGVTSAFVTVQLGLSNLDNARMTTLVSQILQDEAERIRLQNWSAITAMPSTATVPLPAQFENSIAGNGRLTLERNVSAVAGNSDSRVIEIVCNWKGISGTSHTRKLFLRYARGGLYDYYYGSGTPES